MTITLHPWMLWLLLAICPVLAGLGIATMGWLTRSGDYDFGPEIVGFVWLVASAAWWAALCIGYFL